MKHRNFKTVVVALICVAMLLGTVPTTAFASIANWAQNNVTFSGTSFGTDGYYTVISQKDYTLVPGAATETEMVLNNSTGTRRQVLHIIEVDPSNPDVSILPGYYNIDKLAENPANASVYRAAGVTGVTQYYEDELGYNVVGAMNTDLDYSDNAPRVLVYNGQILSGYAKASAPNSVLYVWNNNGEISCEVTSYKKADMEAGVANGTLLHAISVSFAMTVRNGELVSKTVERTSDSAARSMVGIKEDGTLVLVMNDGRNANNSKGFCNYELGESMLALGCKWAANCDGGGSSAIVTKRAGEDNWSLRCVPCDGAERPTKSSVVVVSNVGKTGILDSVNIESDYDLFAPGTTYTFGTTAIDTHGYSMALPSDISWALSDASFGTVENGTFVSNGTLGDVNIQVISGGDVVGEKTITVANPTTLNFEQESTVLPYGKTTKLEFVSYIGEAPVYLDGSSFDFALSNPAAGTLDGLVFTATSDDSIKSTVVTATYVPTGDELNYTIEFGKGSEIVWDFEDGDLHGFLGQQDAYDWQLAHGVSTPFGYSGDGLNTLINKGQISTDVSSTAFISTVANGGKVHNGGKALGFTFDMTQNNFNNWTYCVMFNISNVDGDVVFRDVANGKTATKFGCWVYVPYGFYTAENNGALALQANLFGGANKASAAQIGLNMQYNGKNLNALKESDIPENRWVYAVADISGYNYVSLVDPLQMNFRSPSIMRMYIKPSVAQKLTYYFDDFTLDYSSAVDDRVPPVISDPQYAPNDTNLAFDDGAQITEPAAGFTAYVSDANSGIDASTAQIYVDGNKVSTKVSGNMIFCNAVSLGVGSHKVKFEVADRLGNYTTLTRTIISNTSDSDMNGRVRIEISGHNDSNSTPMPGSIYYIDVYKNISAKESGKFTLSLNTANAWLLDQMVVADNTNVSYDVNPTYPNEVTFNYTCSNNSDDEAVMLCIPVEVYNPLLTNGVSDNAPVTVSGKSFVAPLSVEMTFCSINNAYGNYFKYSVAELNGIRTIVRHEHTEVALEDKEATEAEAGYTGRTYCDVCGSVVDWGTTIPKLVHTHSYEIVNGKFVCSDLNCGEVYTGTGLLEVNGKNYYTIGGNVVSGWQKDEDDWYYFDPETFTTVDTLNNGYVTYEFEPNGKLVSGLWYVTDEGRRYYYGPTYWTGKASADYLVEIDGKNYYFNKYGYCMTGHKFIKLSQSDFYQWYDFGEDGAMIGTWDYTGFAEQFGYKYYLENGVTQYGMHLVDGAYYYSPSANHFAVSTNLERYCAANNGLLPNGTYRFGADGKMLDKTVCCVDGTLYYYELGQIAKNTTFSYNDTEYEVDNNGKVHFTGTITDAFGLTDIYSDGDKYIKNGIVEEDGELYYYENDVKIAKGMVKVGDDYYYFANSLKAFRNGTYTLYANKLIDGFKAGEYTFDAEGKMVIGAEKDGLVEEGGKFYFYENGVKVKKGMVKIGDDYYYFGVNYYAFTDGTYYLYANKLIDGFKAGNYTFDAEGKMVIEAEKDGLVEEGGKLYFYENGVKVKKGMVKIDDDYYYFGVNYHAFTDGTYYLYANPDKMIDGFGAGNYTFDVNGKMVLSD